MPDTPKTAIHVRLTDTLRDRLEDWRRAQPNIPPRSEALRRLIDKALDDEAPRNLTNQVNNTPA
jgi:hypothetical protein